MKFQPEVLAQKALCDDTHVITAVHSPAFAATDLCFILRRSVRHVGQFPIAWGNPLQQATKPTLVRRAHENYLFIYQS